MQVHGSAACSPTTTSSTTSISSCSRRPHPLGSAPTSQQWLAARLPLTCQGGAACSASPSTSSTTSPCASSLFPLSTSSRRRRHHAAQLARTRLRAGGADGMDSTSWDADVLAGGVVRFNDSAQRRAVMHWSTGSPSLALIVKKPGNAEATAKMGEIAVWLQAHDIKVLVERPVAATEFPEIEAYDPQAHKVDFCITLGGDGTVLHLASLFERDAPLPPIISFAMGSLGFLTPFDSADFAYYLSRVLSADNPLAPLYITLRSRRQCKLKHAGGRMDSFNVLNEVVIDRGASPGAVLLSVFTDGAFMTTIEADGLIISTPSGSTAYSMSAGGPMVAPSVPCSILTPIAPLSLSFRPLVIPESSDILIQLPDYSRSHARVSFDGKGGIRMRKGSFLRITPAQYPLPMISMGMLDSDWYEAITDKLKWNQSLREFPRIPATGGEAMDGSILAGPDMGGNHSSSAAEPKLARGRTPTPQHVRDKDAENLQYIARISKM